MEHNILSINTKKELEALLMMETGLSRRGYGEEARAILNKYEEEGIIS
jgi:hypothetical protein